MLANHAARMVDTLHAGDADAAAALVDQLITSLKPHLDDDRTWPLVSELLASALAATDDPGSLRELLIAMMDPVRRLTGDDASQAMLLLIEVRDPVVASHHRAVESIAERVAVELGFEADSARRLTQAARVFDVGKLFVPGRLLHGEIELDNRTWPLLKQHVEDGIELLSSLPELEPLVPIVRWHHERFDGFGYPDRLAGVNIPRESRVLALADAWHAMLSHRPYRVASPVSEAIMQVSDGRGRQWDPFAVDALLSLIWGDRRRTLRAS